MVDSRIIHTEEYNFLWDHKDLGSNICLIGLGGSHAYGTNIETSDVDLRGVAVRSARDILTGRDFEQVDNSPTDTTIYSFDKAIRLFLQCNPNCIELLGLRPQDYLVCEWIGQELLNNKSLFLSKRCIGTFGGYANQQLYRLRQKTLQALTPEEFNGHIAKTINGMQEHLERSWGILGLTAQAQNGNLIFSCPSLTSIPLESFYGLINEVGNVVKEYNKESKRNNHAIEHAKINKHAMHLLRLYMMACDILNKGEIITYREDEHDLLMDIRNGKFSGEDGLMNKEFFDLVNEYEAKFDEAKKNTKLPDQPDEKAIADFQFRINKSLVF